MPWPPIRGCIILKCGVCGCVDLTSVRFEDLRDAEDALHYLDGHRLRGKRMEIQYAQGDRKSELPHHSSLHFLSCAEFLTLKLITPKFPYPDDMGPKKPKWVDMCVPMSIPIFPSLLFILVRQVYIFLWYFYKLTLVYACTCFSAYTRFNCMHSVLIYSSTSDETERRSRKRVL